MRSTLVSWTEVCGDPSLGDVRTFHGVSSHVAIEPGRVESVDQCPQAAQQGWMPSTGAISSFLLDMQRPWLLGAQKLY